MKLNFYKYQGTGNDFIIIDNRDLSFDRDNYQLINHLCDRKFGIGGDGLMLLENDVNYDFRMVYFNSDGHEGTMCGNGGRSMVAFALDLGLIKDNTKFIAIDGEHSAKIFFDKNGQRQISLEMQNLEGVEINEEFCYLDTGSPHYVTFVDDVLSFDVFNEGKSIRNNDRFNEVGTNVNFIEKHDDILFVRTYERGVEDETLSCGTGIVASVISAYIKGVVNESCDVKALGGNLKVEFENITDTLKFENIWLTGPASMSFKGEIEI